MPRPAAVVLGWVAATAAAIAVAYAGVSTVAGGVVQPLPATVGQPPPVDLVPSDTATDTPTDTPSPAAPGSPPASSPRAVVTPPATTATSSPAAQPEVRSYGLVGGTATLRYEPGRVTVVSAEPAQGFTVDIEGNGTAEVRVEFDSDAHRSRLRGDWEGGPRERIEEDADRGEDDDRDDDDDDDDGDDD